jgi:hypothetical protein
MAVKGAESWESRSGSCLLVKDLETEIGDIEMHLMAERKGSRTEKERYGRRGAGILREGVVAIKLSVGTHSKSRSGCSHGHCRSDAFTWREGYRPQTQPAQFAVTRDAADAKRHRDDLLAAIKKYIHHYLRIQQRLVECDVDLVVKLAKYCPKERRTTLWTGYRYTVIAMRPGR